MPFWIEPNSLNVKFVMYFVIYVILIRVDILICYTDDSNLARTILISHE